MRLLTGPGRPKRFFDRIASRYDGINARLYKREWLDRVREHASPRGKASDVALPSGPTPLTHSGHRSKAPDMNPSGHMNKPSIGVRYWPQPGNGRFSNA